MTIIIILTMIITVLVVYGLLISFLCYLALKKLAEVTDESTLEIGGKK